MILIVVNIIFLLAFLLFAYFNFNDPDTPLWVTVYVFAAVACGLAAFKLYFPVIYLLLLAFYLTYAVVLFFGKDGVKDWIVKYNRPQHYRKQANYQALHRKNKGVFWIVDH